MDAKRFAGKVAVVTGGAQGIGRAVALRLAKEGASIVIADQNAQEATKVLGELEALGAMGAIVSVDVQKDDCGSRLVRDAVTFQRRIDLAVLCAGIIGMGDWARMTIEDWDRMMNTNLRGTFLCLQAIANQMIDQKSGGAMITLGSTSGHGPRPDAAHYGASKAGIIHLSRSAALGLAPHRIRVNVISPGVVRTSMWERVVRDRAALQGVSPDEYEAKTLGNVPLQRAATPDEIASLAAFLLSEEASYITGQVILQDGGYSLRVA
jgi:NAD(P)-dependent dehydrogenase (short-subunit alcohol dehydrogenase family)